MDDVRVDGARTYDQQETILGVGLIRIQEYVRRERTMLGDAASFRTNHDYDRLEQAGRRPGILGCLKASGNSGRSGSLAVEHLARRTLPRR